MDLEARYEFLEKIGEGSFAGVYRARDRELGREVAIKQIHAQYLSNPKQLARYWQEAQLLASLHHPNICTIFDIYRDRGWLILELMQANLADRMEGRQMDLRALRTTLAHCLRALKYLHARGIVHGDIKPSNLMIDARKRVKLGDFGLARRVSDEDGSLLKGTTKYMAPETVSDEFGEVGPASDLYSLGFAAYELMCGPNFESLFPGLSAFGRNKQIAWMMWHAASDRRLPDIHRVLEGVPGDLAHVIQKLCEKDRSKRYESADEALSDLNIDLKIINRGSGDDEMADEAPASDRKRLLLAGGAFAISLVVSLLMLFLPGSGSNGGVPAGPKHVVVREVDAASNRLVVEDPEDGIPEELAVGSRPRIFLRNAQKNILLRELQPGDRLEIERAAGGDAESPSISIVASRPVTSRGRLRHIDVNAQRVSVAVDEGDTREDVRLRVPERAGVLLNGRAARLQDLREGDRVTVSHLDDVAGEAGRVVDTLHVRRLSEAVGFVREVDPTTRRLTVRFGRGQTSGSLTLMVGNDVDISLRGDEKALTLADLRPDDRVRVWHDTVFHEIVVTRDPRTYVGIIDAVRPERNEVDVQTSSGGKYSVQVSPSAIENGDVTLGRAAVDVGDLRRFDNIEVTGSEPQNGVVHAGTVLAGRPPINDRWVVLISVEQFYDRGVSPLDYATENVELLGGVMRDRYAVGDDRLLTIRDETQEEIQSRLREFLENVRSQTQLVVYVVTRGYVADDGRTYLAAKDLHTDKIDQSGVPLDWLVEQLDASLSRDKLLLLDISHAGRGRDLNRQPSAAAMVDTLRKPPQSTTIIASSRGEERGTQLPGHEYGTFAAAVAGAFGGDADRDRDLHLTDDELFSYLRERMGGLSASAGGGQTPVLIAPRS